jgi:hypothetical protein
MQTAPQDSTTAGALPPTGVVASPRRLEVWLVVVILASAALLRLVLAVLNDEANDPHYRVVQLLLDGRRNLTVADCRECFHPKLYYAVVAWLVRLLGTESLFALERVGQLLSATAGGLTLWLVYRLLLRCPFSAAARLVVLALVAWNPALVAINVQLTNDSLAIFLGVAGTYAVVRYLDGRRLRYFGMAAVALALACATKGTTWVCGIAVLLVLATAALAQGGAGRRRLREHLLAPALLVAMLGAISLSGYDFGSYRSYANLGARATLCFFRPTHVGRPGVVSVYDSYLSFKLVELLRFPYTRNGFPIQPPHRSSVFSQLYGRLHFLHFANWPPTWSPAGERHHLIGRWNILLGFVPTSLFGLGLALRVGNVVRTVRGAGRRQWPGAVDKVGLLCLLLVLGSFAFIVFFTASYRDFSAMKPVYMFPAMFGFACLLAEGYQFVWSRWTAWPRARLVVWGVSSLLLLGYAADVLVLVAHLAGRSGAEVARHLGFG